jgi:hypothetical protein
VLHRLPTFAPRPPLQVLDALLGIAALFTAVVIPYDFAFPERTAAYSGAWVLGLRVLFGLDLVLGFFTTLDGFDNQARHS